jgi:hypothetical protein
LKARVHEIHIGSSMYPSASQQRSRAAKVFLVRGAEQRIVLVQALNSNAIKNGTCVSCWLVVFIFFDIYLLIWCASFLAPISLVGCGGVHVCVCHYVCARYHGPVCSDTLNPNWDDDALINDKPDERWCGEQAVADHSTAKVDFKAQDFDKHFYGSAKSPWRHTCTSAAALFFGSNSSAAFLTRASAALWCDAHRLRFGRTVVAS